MPPPANPCRKRESVLSKPSAERTMVVIRAQFFSLSRPMAMKMARMAKQRTITPAIIPIDAIMPAAGAVPVAPFAVAAALKQLARVEPPMNISSAPITANPAPMKSSTAITVTPVGPCLRLPPLRDGTLPAQRRRHMRGEGLCGLRLSEGHANVKQRVDYAADWEERCVRAETPARGVRVTRKVPTIT